MIDIKFYPIKNKYFNVSKNFIIVGYELYEQEIYLCNNLINISEEVIKKMTKYKISAEEFEKGKYYYPMYFLMKYFPKEYNKYLPIICMIYNEIRKKIK